MHMCFVAPFWSCPRLNMHLQMRFMEGLQDTSWDSCSRLVPLDGCRAHQTPQHVQAPLILHPLLPDQQRFPHLTGLHKRLRWLI